MLNWTYKSAKECFLLNYLMLSSDIPVHAKEATGKDYYSSQFYNKQVMLLCICTKIFDNLFL